jgi:hypothetical protein
MSKKGAIFSETNPRAVGICMHDVECKEIVAELARSRAEDSEEALGLLHAF